MFLQPPKTSRLGRVAAAARRLLPARDGLHICKACGRDFVCPIAWETDGDDHWRITLHCGECDTWCDVRATNEEAKAFDLELDRQTRQIRRVLAEFDREHMRSLLTALERGLIDVNDLAH